MPEQIEFIQLEVNEDAASVRDRLSFYRGQRILLIWPEEGTALNRKLDLVLVQREAMRRAIHLALVTHDSEVIEHAKELNISTYETIGASQRSRWRRGRSKIFTSRSQQPEDTPDHEDLMPVASRVRVERSFSVPALLRFIILIALLAAGAAVMYLVVPSATITLELAQERIEVSSTIYASPLVTSTNVEQGVIPARIVKVEIEEFGTRQTTGSQNLAPTPANGTVTFINASDQAIAIPQGTIVSTSAGIPLRFETTSETVLPAGVDQLVEVAIRALPDSAGTIGNVQAGLINTVEADWASNVTVINLAPTTGGENRVLPSVTETDRERLLAAVRQQLQARGLIELQPTDPNEIIIPETLQIAEERADWMIFSAEVGALEPTLSLTMRAIVQVTIINPRFAEAVAFAQIGQKIPPGKTLIPESVEYINQPVTQIDDQGVVTFGIQGSGTVRGIINPPQLQQQLAGKSIAEAEGFLRAVVQLAEGIPPKIELVPSWGSRLPILPIRITIRTVENPLP